MPSNTEEPMPETATLSDPAIVLLRLYLSGQRVELTPDNKEAYRELARAGIMYPLSTFARGPESIFRFTEEGWNRREAWISAPAAARQAGSL
jgi:hypothetical protein